MKLGTVVALLIICTLAIWSTLIEPNRLVVHSEEIKLDRWPVELNGLRIAALGDIHAGSAFIDVNKLRSVVALTNNQHPDLIVLLGDYVVTGRLYPNNIAPRTIAQVLKDLQAPLGVYAVLGNHDAWIGSLTVKQAFESVGIKVLNNAAVELRNNRQSFWLAGLADLWTGVPAVEATLRKIPPGATTIAITHNPDIFPQLPASVNLLLAAHTHGGQVNLPLVGRLVVPSDYGQRYAAGSVTANGRHLFVTTGIGTSIFPIRFRVPPEIALLTLNLN